ncbi:hypothetical protein [Parapedobacter sp.]|jgi:hypothetical protein
MDKSTDNQSFQKKDLLKTSEEIEKEKEEKLVNLIVQIIVEATLKEYYENCD